MTNVFLTKSLLSLVVLVMTGIALVTMFEALGRRESRFDVEMLKRVHRINGLLLGILSAVIAVLCLQYLAATKAEPSARAVFHSAFALTVFVLLFLKVSFVRYYRQFYPRAQTTGLLLAVFVLLTLGMSAGYFALVKKAGPETSHEAVPGQGQPEKAAAKTDSDIPADRASVARGKAMYESKCSFCHDAFSTDQGVGPGHKGILRNPVLPVSGRPATRENVAIQIRSPFRDMPSFSYLSDAEVHDLVSFLGTL